MQIEGRNPVFEVLRSKKEVQKIYIQDHIIQDTKINGIVKKAKRRGIKIIRKTKKELDRASATGVHQGIIAFSKNVDNLTLDDILFNRTEKPLRMLYIREAFHEYNIGAIIRTAECAGYDAVILPPKINLTSQIVRASMGASEHINVLSESLFPLINKLKDNNFKIVGIERTPESVNYSDIDLTGDLLLIIGGEDRSLSEQIIEKCDQMAIIPMKGMVNSLNMSVAAAIVVFESLRQSS